jgi:putative transcriptional regulator
MRRIFVTTEWFDASWKELRLSDDSLRALQTERGNIMSDMSFGEKLIQSARQAEEHSAGKRKLRTNMIEILPVPDYKPQEIKSIRARLGLTQGIMGGIIGVSTKTVEAWEVGYRRPSSSAMRVLAELDTNPRYFEKIAQIERLQS